MTLQGWIVYNGNLPGNKFIDFAEMIQDAASNKNSKTTLIKNNEILSLVDSNPSPLQVLHHPTDSSFPDYIVFTDKDIYLARQLEYLNIPVFNTAEAIAISDDKIATYQALAVNNLPIPKTIIAPKIFSKEKSGGIDISLVMSNLGLPLIIKEAFGSFGEQVYLVNNEEELKVKMEELHGKPYIFQEFIESSYGRDLRLHVVGNKVVAAMERCSQDDFRANITSGGTMKPYYPTPIEEKIAIEGANAIGADFAGVDLLFGRHGPIICEINSNAHIRNLYDCTGINVADHMIDYILDAVNNRRK